MLYINSMITCHRKRRINGSLKGGRDKTGQWNANIGLRILTSGTSEQERLREDTTLGNNAIN